MQSIKKVNTIEELNKLKENFISECNKREKRILVSEMIGSIQDFVTAKKIFESVAVQLMSKKDGKALINKYTKVIKENRSLKTLYAYNEGLNENKTNDSKKTYITEALSLGSTVNSNEYNNGLGKMVSIISEAFNLLGDEFVLENVCLNKTDKMIGESLYYLSTTKKDIRNLNEYMKHIDTVSENINESKSNDINIDLSLDDIVKNMKKNTMSENIDVIFNNDDKESTFKETKEICLEMIHNQKSNANNNEIISELNQIEMKLNEKKYTFDTFTKDMLYMTELQELLK